MEPERFRLFFWQKFIPLLALPILGFMAALSPAVQSWGPTGWTIAGVVVGLAIAAYLANAWLRSLVSLDAEGLTLPGGDVYPHAKLLKVKQMGQYRARMCYDPDIPDKHMHVTLDLVDADGFVDALLDWYAETAGHELPVPDDDHAQAA
jgi:hypothetical protein